MEAARLALLPLLSELRSAKVKPKGKGKGKGAMVTWTQGGERRSYEIPG
jgi:hypothetical protein